MSQDALLELIGRLPVILIRFFTIILLVLHIFFSIIMVRQTGIMNKIVEAKISPTIYLAVVFHLMLSVGVLIWALLFLFFFSL